MLRFIFGASATIPTLGIKNSEIERHSPHPPKASCQRAVFDHAHVTIRRRWSFSSRSVSSLSKPNAKKHRLVVVRFPNSARFLRDTVE